MNRSFGFTTAMRLAALVCCVSLFVACRPTPPANAPLVENTPANEDASANPQTARGVIRIATGSWPPYYSPDLVHGGVALRIVREAFRRSGYVVDYTYLPWNTAYDETKAGNYDATVGWALRPDRVLHFHYSRSIFQTRWVFFHRADHPFAWKTYADLTSQRVGATDEYSYSEDFYAALESGQFSAQWEDSDDANYQKLMDGDIDVFPQAEVVGYFDLRRLFGADAVAQFRHHPLPLGTGGNHLLMLRTNPRAHEVLDAFDDGLARLQEEGLVQEWLAQRQHIGVAE